jgi:hypothetical protein
VVPPGLPPPPLGSARGSTDGLEGMPSSGDRLKVMQRVVEKKLIFDAHCHFYNYRQESEGLAALGRAMDVVSVTRPPSYPNATFARKVASAVALAAHHVTPRLRSGQCNHYCTLSPDTRTKTLALIEGVERLHAERSGLCRIDRVPIQEDVGWRAGLKAARAPPLR